MANIIKLHFECVVKCNPDYADDLGEAIAGDMLMEFDNGVDYLEWNYNGCEVL